MCHPSLSIFITWPNKRPFISSALPLTKQCLRYWNENTKSILPGFPKSQHNDIAEKFVSSFSFEFSFNACFYDMILILFFSQYLQSMVRGDWYPLATYLLSPICYVIIVFMFFLMKNVRGINNDWFSPSGLTKILQIIRSVTLWHCGFLSGLVWCSFKIFQIFLEYFRLFGS